MCSIYGAIGPQIDANTFAELAAAARDRGRDGGRWETYTTDDGHKVMLGNWRATPTPELEHGPLQPYDRLVHNGTIANDVELGRQEGEIDSQVLSRYLRRANLAAFVSDLEQVRGSYAVAAFNGHTVLGATNYKPLYYYRRDNTIYFSSMARHFERVTLYGHAPVRLDPYTAIDFRTGHIVPIGRRQEKRVAVIASSGLDSTVVATKLVRDGWKVTLLHFTYGCHAETREVAAIKNIAQVLDCEFKFLHVDLAQILGLRSSRLFDKTAEISGAIAGSEFAHEWVPGRNFVFVALATAWAEANGHHAVALGNNLEEAGAYPDNEEEFTTLLNKAVPYAVQAHYAMDVLSPVGNLMKHEIVALGLKLKAPFHLTWSCYKGGDVHCGECGPCFMRRTAFARNGAVDPVF